MVAASDLIWRGLYRRLALVGIVVAMAGGVAWGAGDVTGGSPLVITGALYFVLVRSGRVRRSAYRLLLARRYRAQVGDDEVAIAVTPRGIRSQTGASTTLVGWPDVTGILEDERVVVVQLKSRFHFLLVPRVAFPSPDALATFHALLTSGANAQLVDGEGAGPSGWTAPQ